MSSKSLVLYHAGFILPDLYELNVDYGLFSAINP